MTWDSSQTVVTSRGNKVAANLRPMDKTIPTAGTSDLASVRWSAQEAVLGVRTCQKITDQVGTLINFSLESWLGLWLIKNKSTDCNFEHGTTTSND